MSKRVVKFKIVQTAIIAIAAITLAGCVGPMVQIHTPEQAGVKAFESTGQIRTINVSEGQKMSPLGSVEGYSCKNKLWDPAATSEAALLQLKISAIKLGATSISNLVCTEGRTSLVTNCWQSFRCSADAHK